MDYLFKPIVLITGFGPFGNHPINASWESVKALPKHTIENKHNIELVQLEIPVTYENVDEFIPALWETHEPKLVIHVGVSGVAKEITLETLAHRKNYKKPDCLGYLPTKCDFTCTSDGPVKITCQLDVKRICDDFNSKDDSIKAIVSQDAGRYLCEYTYYTSLSIDPKRALFVHVPDMDVYKTEDTARGLEQIIELCLKQINEREVTKSEDENEVENC